MPYFPAASRYSLPYRAVVMREQRLALARTRSAEATARNRLLAQRNRKPDVVAGRLPVSGDEFAEVSGPGPYRYRQPGRFRRTGRRPESRCRYGSEYLREPLWPRSRRAGSAARDRGRRYRAASVRCRRRTRRSVSVGDRSGRRHDDRRSGRKRIHLGDGSRTRPGEGAGAATGLYRLPQGFPRARVQLGRRTDPVDCAGSRRAGQGRRDHNLEPTQSDRCTPRPEGSDRRLRRITPPRHSSSTSRTSISPAIPSRLPAWAAIRPMWLCCARRQSSMALPPRGLGSRGPPRVP